MKKRNRTHIKKTADCGCEMSDSPVVAKPTDRVVLTGTEWMQIQADIAKIQKVTATLPAKVNATAAKIIRAIQHTDEILSVAYLKAADGVLHFQNGSLAVYSKFRPAHKGWLVEKTPLRKSAMMRAIARRTGRTVVDMPLSKLPKRPRGIPKPRAR